MHSPVHVCYVQGVVLFERITLRNAARPILKKKKNVKKKKKGGGQRPCAESSLRLPIHVKAIAFQKKKNKRLKIWSNSQLENHKPAYLNPADDEAGW